MNVGWMLPRLIQDLSRRQSTFYRYFSGACAPLARLWDSTHRSSSANLLMTPDSAMMRSLRLATSLAVLPLVLCGCTGSREVPFNEADFVGTSGRGTGVVTGRAYGILNDTKELDADNEIVVLTPVTPYTTENVRRRFVNGENLQSADRRIDKYLRSATTDAQGYFTIREIPPGEYYVECGKPS